MDQNLDAIVPLPEELEAEIRLIDADEELASPEQDVEENVIFEHHDEFNFDVAMFVVEENGEAVEQELEDAASVMAGEKAFPCMNCEKICKSKAGLTRHTNAKHGDKASVEGKASLSSAIASFTEKELSAIVDKIKAKITEDGFWGSEVTTNMVGVKSTKTLFENIFPIYQRFCRKKNQDTFLMDFYELIPKSTVLLQSDNQQLCSLIMIGIPDHLVSLFKKSQQSASGQKGITELSEVERGPLSYIAGYVLSQLRKKSSNDEIQLLLQSMMRPSTENIYIETRSRGGLVTPCTDLVQLLEVAEIVFREFTAKQLTGVVKNIPCEKLCNSTLDSPLVKSLWDNILLGCGQEVTKQTHKLCLENIIMLYIRVRSFSYAKDYINKFKLKEKTKKSKALRKELKRKSSDKE